MQLFNINALDSYLDSLNRCNSSIFLPPNNHNSKRSSSKTQYQPLHSQGGKQSPNISLPISNQHSNGNLDTKATGSLGRIDGNAATVLDSFTLNSEHTIHAGLHALQTLGQFNTNTEVNYRSSAYRNRKRLKGEDHYKAVTFLLLDAF